jgi:serine/threonine protein kinase
VDAAPEQDEPPAALPAPGVSEAQRARVRARLFGADAQAPVHLIAGKYRRLSLLGEGGIGVVWEVEHVLVGRRFALKLLKDRDRESTSHKRFLREARAAAKVHHENIVEVTDAGATEDGTPFVVMELLVGQTLAQAIDEAGAMPWPRVRGILAQLAGALGCAHGSGIVHRDLKAENVMLIARSGSADFCKIVDFGLAKVLDPDRTQHSRPGSVFGTPATMSPEQIRGEAIDGRTDVYALGCMTLHMLTGRRPFVGPTHESVFAQHLSDPPPSVGDAIGDPELAARIDSFVARAMAKDRIERIPDMAAVLRAIAAIDAPPGTTRAASAAGALTPPDGARPPAPEHAARRWGGIAAAVAAGGLALIGGWWWKASQGRESRLEPDQAHEQQSGPDGFPEAVVASPSPPLPDPGRRSVDPAVTEAHPTLPSGAEPASRPGELEAKHLSPPAPHRDKKPRPTSTKRLGDAARAETSESNAPAEAPSSTTSITPDNVLSKPLPNPFARDPDGSP